MMGAWSSKLVGRGGNLDGKEGVSQKVWKRVVEEKGTGKILRHKGLNTLRG